MELVEPPSGWQWSKDLSKAERRRLMRSIGVSMDTRSARSTTPVTLEQWGQAVANGWVVEKRKRPSGPRQPAPDRRASRSASMIVLAEYARKRRSA